MQLKTAVLTFTNGSNFIKENFIESPGDESNSEIINKNINIQHQKFKVILYIIPDNIYRNFFTNIYSNKDC